MAPDYILGASGSMDIAYFLNLELLANYPQPVLDELIFVSKEWLTDLMNAMKALPADWRFEGTKFQAVLEAHVDVYDIWFTYKGLMRLALRHELPENNVLQQQVSKILELMPKERDD